MLDFNELLKLLLVGGIAVLIREIVAGLQARAASKRADEQAHIEAADALSESSADYVQRAIEQYEARIARYDGRLVTLEEKCHRYEMAFESMREDLLQARKTITQLELANGELRKRVKHLEEENAELRRRLDAVTTDRQHGD